MTNIRSFDKIDTIFAFHALMKWKVDIWRLKKASFLQ
jgi:hypothetical protein